MSVKKYEETNFNQAYKNMKIDEIFFFKIDRVNELYKQEEKRAIINEIRDELYNDYEEANKCTVN